MYVVEITKVVLFVRKLLPVSVTLKGPRYRFGGGWHREATGLSVRPSRTKDTTLPKPIMTQLGFRWPNGED